MAMNFFLVACIIAGLIMAEADTDPSEAEFLDHFQFHAEEMEKAANAAERVAAEAANNEAQAEDKD